MESVNRNIIWAIIATMIGLGVVFLIFVSFHRTSITKSEVRSQLETIQAQKSCDSTDIGLQKEIRNASPSTLEAKAKNIWDEQRYHSTKLYLITLGTALLIGFSCFSIGAFCGFLFGIPRIISSSGSSSTALDDKSKNLIFHNDNLVQISDWLTKIIVGVGLTQIGTLPDKLNALGKYLGPSFTTNLDGLPVNDSTKAIAISTVLYFLILGFIACYLWTRFQFSNMLRETMKSENNDQQF